MNEIIFDAKNICENGIVSLKALFEKNKVSLLPVDLKSSGEVF